MKSVIVYQLPIPTDVMDNLCSFIYYKVEETIARNKIKYNAIVCDLFYTVRIDRGFPYYYWNYSYNYATIFIYNIQSRFDVQFYICCKCGNYTAPNRRCTCNKMKYLLY